MEVNIKNNEDVKIPKYKIEGSLMPNSAALITQSVSTETDTKTSHLHATTRTGRSFKKIKLERVDTYSGDDLCNNSIELRLIHDGEPGKMVPVSLKAEEKEPTRVDHTRQQRCSARVITKKHKLEQDEKEIAIPDQNLLVEDLSPFNALDKESNKGQQIRSSARVVKKLKLDLLSSQVVEKKIEKKEEIKTDVKRNFKPLWASDEKSIFFEAINEFGKDFENVHLYMTNKLKKKGISEHLIKTKEQIRHFYNKTWHEISKHVKFSDSIKKVIQELYGIINYGELRKKIGLVNEKSLLKLCELIYCGSTVLRVKGKTVRVKTPLCRALRNLNQLDEKYNEIKLPNRVTVELRPKNMASFLRVQTMAQNPRIRTVLPLQKRLSSLISCINRRWKSFDAILYDKALISSNTITTQCVPPIEESEEKKEQFTHVLRFCPPFVSKIELPTINLGEYLTRQNICLNAYEDRLGIKSPEEYKTPSKSWQRSGCKKGNNKNPVYPEKISVNIQPILTPDDQIKKEPDMITSNEIKSNADLLNVVDDAVNTILLLQQDVKSEQIEEKSEEKSILKEHEIKLEPKEKEDADSLEVVLDRDKLDKIAAIKKGWTEQDSDSLTIGEMYLMFGSDSKLVLEYSWDDLNGFDRTDDLNLAGHNVPNSSESSIQNRLDTDIDKNSVDVSYSLSQLLSLAKLNHRNIAHCPCGHVCNLRQETTDSRVRKLLNDTVLFEHQTRTEDQIRLGEEIKVEDQIKVEETIISDPNPTDFRRPYSVQQQLDSIQRLKPKYSNRKGKRQQVVVERKLPLLPNNVESGHQIVRMNIISQQRTTEIKKEPVVTTNTNSESVTYLTTRDTVLPTETVINNCQSLPNLSEDMNTIPTVPNSPTGLLKEGEHQWINAEVGDYSLSSLLGHLESPMKGGNSNLGTNEYSRLSQDVDAQLQSLLTESSVDFAAKFADLAAEVVKEVKP